MESRASEPERVTGPFGRCSSCGVFRTAGAYAAAMAGTYNSRPLAPEVLVDGSRWAVVRPRVDIDALIAADRVPDWLRGCADDPSG